MPDDNPKQNQRLVNRVWIVCDWTKAAIRLIVSLLEAWLYV
ncbi:MAG TPA: hypothetical protein VKX17_07385 [Planctomycetota bacterium]|nr:hypothetical protein [Planctomycetota bacterium]